MRWSYPLVRQQLSNITGPLYRQPRKHILEIAIRVMPVHECRLNQAHDCRSPFSAAQRPCEEPVFASKRSWPNLVVGYGVFQGSCRVNRLTMPLFSRPVALDPGSTTRYRSAPSYASGLTTAPVFAPWLVRTVHVVGPRPDGPALDAVRLA